MSERLTSYLETSRARASFMTATLLVGGAILEGAVRTDTARAQGQCTSDTVQVPGGSSSAGGCVDSGPNSAPTEQPQPPQEETAPPTEDPAPPRERAPRKEKNKRKNETSTKESVETTYEPFIDFNQNAKNPNGSNKWGDRMASGGCGVVAGTMIVASKERNPNITPTRTGNLLTSRKLFGSKIKKHWGFVFLANRYDFHLKRGNLEDARRADKKGGRSVILFQGGYFASPNGHYITVRDVKHNKKRGPSAARFILADPYGEGRSGNSEKRNGWTARELYARGALEAWTFIPKNNKRSNNTSR